MKHYGYVYKTTNQINGKIYVGKRVKTKFDTSYKGSGKILKLAFEKYGFENFTCEVLEWCQNADTLNTQEQYWIKTLNSQNSAIGYNIANGGNGGDIFHTLSPEHQTELKENMSRRGRHNKGKYKIYNKTTGQIKAIEPKELESFLLEGWVRGLPPELLERQGNTRRGKKHNEEWVARFKETVKSKDPSQKKAQYKKISEATKRQMAGYSAEKRKELSQAGVKARLEKRGDRKVVWVNKEEGKIKKIIFEDELETYLLDGFKKGMK